MGKRSRRNERQGIYVETEGHGAWLSADEVRRFDDTTKGVTPIAGVPSSIRGVMNIDGAVYPVVAIIPDAHRAVIADDGEVRAVLLVGRARVGVLPEDAEYTPLRELLESYRV